VSADSYRVAARQQAVKSAEAALAATKAGYDVGTRNIVDVLLAERNVYAAKRDHANSRYDYVINTVKLRAASGQLGLDIKELNGWLTNWLCCTNGKGLRVSVKCRDDDLYPSEISHHELANLQCCVEISRLTDALDRQRG
jgi:hypothetical protein